jgi:hypothetical protein
MSGGELSQAVIPALPAPPDPPANERAWDRVRTLLEAARDLEAVVIPEALQRASDAASDALYQGQPAPSLQPVKRELTRVREQVAWTMRIAGHCQARIAHFMGVSQPAVCKILRRVERRVLAQMEADVRQVKVRQAAQLGYILDQAMRAWKDSQERLGEQTSTRDEPDGMGKTIRTRHYRRGPGDPRYLMVALKALQSERELFGLDRLAPPGNPDEATIEAVRTESVTIRQPLRPA